MATFPQMGRVALGESFEFMDTGALHWWINSLPQFVKVLSLTRLLNNIPLLQYISPELFVPTSLKDGSGVHMQRTKDMVHRQKTATAAGNSVMTLFLRGLDEKKLTGPEVMINAEFLLQQGVKRQLLTSLAHSIYC